MNNSRKIHLSSAKFWLIALLGLAALLLVAQQTLAQDETPVDPTPTGPPLHPNFALLDANGNNVLDSGEAISTMNTCGSCHDTAFIALQDVVASSIQQFKVGVQRRASGCGINWCFVLGQRLLGHQQQRCQPQQSH